MPSISEAIYSFITKDKIGKDIHLQIWTFFAILSKTILPIWIGFQSKDKRLETYVPTVS